MAELRGAWAKRAMLAMLAALVSSTVGATAGATSPRSVSLPYELPELGGAAMRGVTIGPIESALHPGRGYGSPAFERGLDEAVRLGAPWISLTPCGRAWDLQATGVDKTFELPLPENQRDMLRAVKQAHARGLRVLLV